MKSQNESTITVEALNEALVEKVWEYWTTPEHITKWNYASDDWHCPHAENNLKVGGTYRARMEAKDGSMGFDFEATYDEIINHKKIAYTMTDRRRATTFFERIDDMTKVTTSFDAENENPVDTQRDGWQAILDNFKKYAEKNA
ncbi:MAG: SRPBCC family protein [Balneolaceae bacterium]|nr:SRPBCC family protein [Balneolaceae bacterium]